MCLLVSVRVVARAYSLSPFVHRTSRKSIGSNRLPGKAARGRVRVSRFGTVDTMVSSRLPLMKSSKAELRGSRKHVAGLVQTALKKAAVDFFALCSYACWVGQ